MAKSTECFDAHGQTIKVFGVTPEKRYILGVRSVAEMRDLVATLEIDVEMPEYVLEHELSLDKRCQIIVALTWMVGTIKWQQDNAAGGGAGSGKPYSQQLQDAATILTELTDETERMDT